MYWCSVMYMYMYIPYVLVCFVVYWCSAVYMYLCYGVFCCVPHVLLCPRVLACFVVYLMFCCVPVFWSVLLCTSCSVVSLCSGVFVVYLMFCCVPVFWHVLLVVVVSADSCEETNVIYRHWNMKCCFKLLCCTM